MDFKPEVVNGYYVHPISDGSFLITITENASTAVGRVFCLGDWWWVALRIDEDINVLYPLDEMDSLAPDQVQKLKSELERRAARPDVAGWSHTRDGAILHFSSPPVEE